MTDEEMAEEFIDTLMKKDETELDKFLVENLGELKLTAKQAGVLLGIIKGLGICSYLAGLKAGRPKWHKVADGDLPKDKKDMLMSEHLILLTKMKGTAYLNIALGKYNFSTQEFNYQHIVGLTDVIAWKEIVLPEEIKENAELKADSTKWEKASDKWKSAYKFTNNQLTLANDVYNKNLDYAYHIESQLTKAKELLEEFREWWRCKYNDDYIENIVQRTEQFLKEIVQ